MFSQVYYLLRSRIDGSYLVAHPDRGSASSRPSAEYLLMFRESYEALSYLNTHGSEVADRFAVESIPGSQVGHLLERWSFTGVGIVQDPLIPKVEFFSRSVGMS